ncbi:MAG: hypothetical protein OEM77_07900 [Nitrosopumilus sp.]|nr:hypothetical protein [Nitrosopumilus sp.]
MTGIHIVNHSSSEELKCNTCLLPMQYQTKRDGKFLWRCFKCGKHYLISENSEDDIEESWSPSR